MQDHHTSNQDHKHLKQFLRFSSFICKYLEIHLFHFCDLGFHAHFAKVYICKQALIVPIMQVCLLLIGAHNDLVI